MPGQRGTQLAHSCGIKARYSVCLNKEWLIGRKSDRRFYESDYSRKSSAQFAHKIGIRVYQLPKGRQTISS